MSRSRGGGGNKRKKQPQKKKKSNKKADPVKFWGDPNKLPQPDGFETSTPDPVAVVNSLGQPPLPGHGAASPHYFKLVYGRATQLAGALAMAGEIDELTLIEPPEPEAPAEPGNEAEDDVDAEDDPLTEDDALVEASSDDESPSASDATASDSEPSEADSEEE